jgi:hypothetical protein
MRGGLAFAVVIGWLRLAWLTLTAATEAVLQGQVAFALPLRIFRPQPGPFDEDLAEQRL